MNIGDLLQKVNKFTIDNSPTILTAFAVAGTATTAYLTGKAALRAHAVLEEAKNESDTWSLEPKEKVALTWKIYIPPVATGLLTVTCIIGANQIGTRRAAAVAAAYTLSEKAFSEYRDKVAEKLGPKKEQAARDEIAQAKVLANPVSDSKLIILDGKSVLCCEAFTGRYFLSDIESLRKAENIINNTINHSYYASLTDFYNEIGLPATTYSDEVGWNVDKMLELKFSSVLTEDGRPCLVLDYHVIPIRDYHRLA